MSSELSLLAVGLGHMASRGPTSPRPAAVANYTWDLQTLAHPQMSSFDESFLNNAHEQHSVCGGSFQQSQDSLPCQDKGPFSGLLTEEAEPMFPYPSTPFRTTLPDGLNDPYLMGNAESLSNLEYGNTVNRSVSKDCASQQSYHCTTFNGLSNMKRSHGSEQLPPPSGKHEQRNQSYLQSNTAASNETDVGDQERMSKDYQHFPDYAWSTPSQGNGQKNAVTEPHKSQFDTQNDSQQNGIVSPQDDRFDHESEWTTMSPDQSPRISTCTTSTDTSLDGQVGDASAGVKGQECGNLLTKSGVHQEFVPELSFQDHHQQSIKSPNEKQNSGIPYMENKSPGSEKSKQLPLSFEEAYQKDDSDKTSQSSPVQTCQPLGENDLMHISQFNTQVVCQEEQMPHRSQQPEGTHESCPDTTGKNESGQSHHEPEKTSQCVSTGTETATLENDDDNLPDTTKAGSITKATGSGPRCVGFGCSWTPVPGSIYCSNRCILTHAAYAIQRLQKSRETHAKGSKPRTVVSLKQEIISFVVASDKVNPGEKTSSFVPEEVIQTSAAVGDDVESEEREGIIPSEPKHVALNCETEKGSTRNQKAQRSHEGGIIPSDVFYKADANENKEARLQNTLYILHKERMDSQQSLASNKRHRLGLRDPKDTKEAKKQNLNEVKGEAQHCDPARFTKVVAVDWQIRQTVRKAFRETLLKRFKEMGGQRVKMKDVARLALQIEKQLYAFLGHAESKYKTKYRTLSFNLKDQKNKGLCEQVLAGEVRPHTLVRMSPQQLASQELAEWRARENKHMIELIEKEQKMEKRPITKTTHKGLIEIDDTTSLMDMQTSTLEREVDKRRRKPCLQRSSVPLDAAKQCVSHLSDLNCKLCKEPAGKNTDGPSSAKAKPASSGRQNESGERPSQQPPAASLDASHSASPDAGPPWRGEAQDAHGAEPAESAAAPSSKSPQAASVSPQTLSLPAPAEESYNGDISDRVEVIGNDGDEDEDDTDHRDGGGGPVPGCRPDETGGQPTRKLVDGSCGLTQKIRANGSLCDAIPEIVQGSVVDLDVVELPCKPLNESDCESKWISSPVKDVQQLPHASSPEKDADVKAASLPGEIWKGFIGLPNVAKVVMKAYPVSGPTDNLAEDLPDSIQIGGRIHPQVVWDYLYKLKATLSKEACIIRFVPASAEEREGYESVFSYLSGRKRYGVISNNSHSVKDLYIIPTGAGQKFPRFLLSLLGPGLNNTEAGAIVGVLVRQKGKRPQTEEQLCEGTNSCRVEQRTTKTCEALRRVQPPGACLGCKSAAHSADARNLKAKKSSPEMKCDQGGTVHKALDNNSKAECASAGRISPITEQNHRGNGREPVDSQKITRDCQLRQPQGMIGTVASDRSQSGSVSGSEEHANRGQSVKTLTRVCNPIQTEQTGKFNIETPILNFKLNQKSGLAGKNVDVNSSGVPGEALPHSAVIQHDQDAAQIFNKQPLKGNNHAELQREPVPLANNAGGQVYRRLLFSAAAVPEQERGFAPTGFPPQSAMNVSTPNAITARPPPRDPRTRRPGSFPNAPVTDLRGSAAVNGVKENGQSGTGLQNVREGPSARKFADVQHCASGCRASSDSSPEITMPPNATYLANAIQTHVRALLPFAQESIEAGKEVFEHKPREKACAVATISGDISPPVNACVPLPSEEVLGQTKALLPTPEPHSYASPDVTQFPPSFTFPPPRCPPVPAPFPIGLFPPLQPPHFGEPFFEFYDPPPRFPARMPFHHLAQEFHPRWFHPFRHPRWPAVGQLFRPYSVRPPRRRFPCALDNA